MPLNKCVCRWGMNQYCSDLRDQGQFWAKDKQVDWLSDCMSQDCVQSLEGCDSNFPNEYGCRFGERVVDDDMFCYIAGTTQMWCKSNTADARCVDGGTSYAVQPLGNAPSQPTMWKPVSNYRLCGTVTGQTASCSCMKN